MDPGLPDQVEDGAPGGAAFRAVTQPSRRAPTAIALAAVGVLAFAFLTKQPAPAAVAPNDVVPPQPSPAAAIISSVGPTRATTPSPPSLPPTLNPSVTPYPTFLAVPAAAGTTQLIPAGPTPVRLTISLPGGWEKASDAMYVKSNGVGSSGLSIGAWSLRHVNTVPCRWSSQEFADPRLMRTAEGQAQALSS